MKTTKELIAELKLSKPSDRESIALRLAATRNSRAVKELIKMANGKYFTNSLSDQLIAINALGKTKDRSALNYLLALSNWTETTSVMITEGIDATARAHFPKAKGALAKALISEESSGEEMCGTRFNPYPKVSKHVSTAKRELSKQINSKNEYIQIKSSIKELIDSIL